MAHGFQLLKDHLTSMGITVEGKISQAWGSGSDNHRQMIRQNIVESLSELLPEEQNLIMNLEKRPNSKNWCISISHTQNGGGWLAVRTPTRIGFDIEMTARVTSTLVSRMATPAEVALCPETTLLWSAKEAAFKALTMAKQPVVLSQLTVTDWQKISSDLHGFKCSTLGQGLITQDENNFFSAFMAT